MYPMAFNVKNNGQDITKTFTYRLEHDQGIEEEQVTYLNKEAGRELRHDIRTDSEGNEEIVRTVEEGRKGWPPVEKGCKRRDETVYEWLDRVLAPGSTPFEADGKKLSAEEVYYDYPAYRLLLSDLRAKILFDTNPFLRLGEERRREAQ